MRILLFIIVLASVSCTDMFDYSPYIVDFSQENSSVNARNIEKLKGQTTDDTITIAVTGDTHRAYDETASFVDYVSRMPWIDLLIHTGDFSDFGLPKQYEWINNILLRMKGLYFVTVGNHDLVGNGSYTYEKMFGEMNFSFIYSTVKFIFINTNSREYKFNGLVPDINWLENELKPGSEFKKAVVVFHTPPFDVDFDSSLETEFHSTVAMYGNVLFTLHGHTHRHEILKPYQDSIPYINTYGVQQQSFYIIQISNDEFIIETVVF
jgi:Icc protein